MTCLEATLEEIRDRLDCLQEDVRLLLCELVQPPLEKITMGHFSKIDVEQTDNAAREAEAERDAEWDAEYEADLAEEAEQFARDLEAGKLFASDADHLAQLAQRTLA